MITVRRSDDRGRAEHGWLSSRHSFSFADYYDPRHMGFRHLRVINEDRVTPGAGFGTHPHHDMEIISYVLDGAIEHRDSLGNGSVIRPGDVQRMTAGTGVTHSEFNPSKTAPLHFLQIWIVPERRGLPPGYEQKHLAPAERPGELVRLASPKGGDAVLIHQDVTLYAAVLRTGEAVDHRFSAGRHGWVQVIDGELRVHDETLTAGDGAAISQEEKLHLQASADAHFLLFDLA